MSVLQAAAEELAPLWLRALPYITNFIVPLISGTVAYVISRRKNSLDLDKAKVDISAQLQQQLSQVIGQNNDLWMDLVATRSREQRAVTQTRELEEKVEDQMVKIHGLEQTLASQAERIDEVQYILLDYKHMEQQTALLVQENQALHEEVERLKTIIDAQNAQIGVLNTQMQALMPYLSDEERALLPAPEPPGLNGGES